MKMTVLGLVAAVGALALTAMPAEAAIFGRRVVVRQQVVAVRAPVVVRQRAAIVVPHHAPAAIIVPHHVPQAILIAP